MGDKYTGTTLIQNTSPEDINKAVLDLLKKTNEVSKNANDDIININANIKSIQASLSAIKYYIVDSGSTVDGYYRKWSDHTIEQWGAAYIPPGAWFGGPWGTSPYYKNVSITFPYTFALNTDIKSIEWSVAEVPPSTFSFPGYYTPPTVSGASFYVFNSTNSATVAISVPWRVNGIW